MRNKYKNILKGEIHLLVQIKKRRGGEKER